MANQGTTPSAPPFPEERQQELQEAYVDAFSTRLRLGKVLATEPSDPEDLFPYTMNFPVYGPHRNRRSSRTAFDDKPHVQGYAEMHADAFQLGPLTGQLGSLGGAVGSYSGEILFDGTTPTLNENPIRPADLDLVKERIREALERSDYWPSIQHAVVGPTHYISRILYDSDDEEETIFQRGNDANPNWTSVPKGPEDRIFVIPLHTDVARLRTHPELGEVKFSHPQQEPTRYVIEARAWNRIDIREREALAAIKVEQAENQVF